MDARTVTMCPRCHEWPVVNVPKADPLCGECLSLLVEYLAKYRGRLLAESERLRLEADELGKSINAIREQQIAAAAGRVSVGDLSDKEIELLTRAELVDIIYLWNDCAARLVSLGLLEGAEGSTGLGLVPIRLTDAGRAALKEARRG